MKKLIFISHANPEDNYFAAWLASKLRLIGYEVWVDIKNLRKGSSFWNEIELKMRNDSIRFISVISEAYITKSRNKNSGVYSEITLAKILSKQIENYVIPIRLDKSSYDDFPLNILPLDTQDFSNNWGKGLKELLAELEVQEIVKDSSNINVLSQWHEYQKIQGKVIKKKEYYGSNWFEIEMPKNVYAYKFIGKIEDIARAIPFSFIRNGDYIIGFFEDDGLEFRFSHREKILVQEIKENEDLYLENGDVLKGIQQRFTYLLNKTINNYFFEKDSFGSYKASNNKRIFYPKYDSIGNGYVSLKTFGKRGRKLYSKAKNVRWRFGLSFVFQMNPFPHLIVSYHLVSSDDNGFLENDKQVKARRSIPSEWFNRHWYERILAFLHLASDMNNELNLVIPVGNDDLIVNLESVMFKSLYSYEEKV